WNACEFYTREELEKVYKEENQYEPSFDYWRVNGDRYKTSSELGHSGYGKDDVEDICVKDDMFGVVVIGYAGRD
ncbi:MAG: hypothetical protein ACRCRT_00490, partial [Cetobacterium somerae]